ncbi:hypothetical protein [Gehongia tenuis]|uniref:Uncharacterized protein n=1 Tax=Gehongia tenuis TaxID=2763655 RepID=A0A926D7P7_9FIRM|nr:hypothetical protein [Gehongia tenuis]MBC8531900.1 hypothetical protein [Gehongia tenuis]
MQSALLILCKYIRTQGRIYNESQGIQEQFLPVSVKYKNENSAGNGEKMAKEFLKLDGR